MSGPAPLRIDRRTARRLCVQGQRLAGPRPASIAETVHDLTMVQLDPTRVVARTEHLVLFSRLGRRFRIDELERMLWIERSLFEYWVHIVPAADHWIHRESMRRYPDRGPRAGLRSRQDTARWLEANAAFRRYVLRELSSARGPLRARDLEDRVADGWQAGGWTSDGRSVATLLDLLWHKGEVMIVGRDGQQRLWDLAERSLPSGEPARPGRTIAREVLDRQLHARGVATIDQFGSLFDGRPDGWERALADLVREGIAVPVTIAGITKGEWFAHADLLDRPWKPRTVALSPFDDLVSDRDHTEALFDFHFRLEIYVPKAARRWGYFVLPVLHGDRLIGRVDPRFDRETRVLRLEAVHAEPGTSASDGAAAWRALATWLGATDIAVPAQAPGRWRGSFGR
jgi:uncharacterized protein YcaQ